MQIITVSHVDHGITPEQLAYLLESFNDRKAFFISTIELPPALGTVPCSLMGPLVGDAPIPEAEVFYAARGDRAWQSRMIEVAYPRASRLVTVIGGPHEGELCVLYTAYGGPCAPQEPGDPGCKDRVASEAFWREHALAIPARGFGAVLTRP